MISINDADLAIAATVNGLVHHAVVLNKSLVVLTENHLLKGGVLMALAWWAWHRARGDDARRRDRGVLVATAVACIAAIGVARGLAQMLPFRVRPLHDPALHFVSPEGITTGNMESWSSFPSDHAALFFALATGLWLVSRRAGALALLHATFVVSLPRLLLGIHYPTDLLVGAAIGIVTTLACVRLLSASSPVRRVVGWADSAPAWFYPAFFLFTFEVAVLFDDVRALMKAFSKYLHLVGT